MRNKEIKIISIDSGKSFDWGRTSKYYAKYRDIYPKEFYQYIMGLGLCIKGQEVLDIGTGTGVLPRSMHRYGAKWIGTDISSEQIEQAKMLSAAQKMDIKYFACPAESVDFPENTFDVITACQCIWYLHHDITAPKFAKLLKDGGSFLILYMGWLPFEDEIAGKSENLILKYNPLWTGFGDTVHPIYIPKEYFKFFTLDKQEEFRVDIPFTRESWHGRMRACRGVGASMTEETLALWERDHWNMLKQYPEQFRIKHYISIARLKVL